VPLIYNVASLVLFLIDDGKSGRDKPVAGQELHIGNELDAVLKDLERTSRAN